MDDDRDEYGRILNNKNEVSLQRRALALLEMCLSNSSVYKYLALRSPSSHK
jgi:hypothetical protein